MDKIYIGDIPKEYHYALWGSNYVDLFNTPVLSSNDTYNYYRLYFYDNTFLYSEGTRQGSYYTTSLQDVQVTDDFFYRRDIDSIFSMCFVVLLGIVFCINLVTSFIKKGGMLGGLL